jgi:multiple sugar transport system ATP-binding protein
MPGIFVRNLYKSFGTVAVLKSISINIEPGSFTVLLGPSGCGKTTLLNAIAGIDPINAGTIEIDGRDVTDLAPSERQLAMVFQSYALYPTMTVRKNLSFALRMSGVPRRVVAEKVGWAADLLQISELLDRKPGQLSGGQRQRVAIGRALVRDCPIFLFDEPLSNLDAKLRTEMRVEIKRLYQRLRKTIVYVTHDQVEAMTLATKIAVMNNGVIEQYAVPQELYDRPTTRFVAGFVGSPQMNFIPAELLSNGHSHQLHLLGRRIACNAYRFLAPVANSIPVLVGIRPEHMVVQPAGCDTVSIRATVVALEPLGPATLVWVEATGQMLCATTTPQSAPVPGTAVQLAFPIEQTSIFGTQSQQRL